MQKIEHFFDPNHEKKEKSRILSQLTSAGAPVSWSDVDSNIPNSEVKQRALEQTADYIYDLQNRDKNFKFDGVWIMWAYFLMYWTCIYIPFRLTKFEGNSTWKAAVNVNGLDHKTFLFSVGWAWGKGVFVWAILMSSVRFLEVKLPFTINTYWEIYLYDVARTIWSQDWQPLHESMILLLFRLFSFQLEPGFVDFFFFTSCGQEPISSFTVADSLV